MLSKRPKNAHKITRILPSFYFWKSCSKPFCTASADPDAQRKHKKYSVNRVLKVRQRYNIRKGVHPKHFPPYESGERNLPIFLSRHPAFVNPKKHLSYSLAARKMLREFYGFKTEKDLKKYYLRIVRSKRHRADAQLKFIDILERRLDVFVFKVGFCQSILEARAEIKRGSFSVNNKVQRCVRYCLNDGDFLSINFSPTFNYPQICQRIKERLLLALKTEKKAKMMPDVYYYYRPPGHLPMRHFDFDYTTLTVTYRRSIINMNEDMIDGGSVFGRHNDLSRVVQEYWNSYLCK